MQTALPVVLTGERLPARLADLPDPPTALFMRGELPRGPTVAVVGTRAPTREGARFARELARDLARAGVSVISGGARGIDTEAHRGALAGRGTSVVVAPAGYDVPYPPENAALFARIVQRGGAYVALVPDDESATRAAFFPRNQCLVALAHAVVVVQAGVRSGARNAAACARHIGRPLFAVPSSPWVPRGRGCLLELRLGALPCEGARDVLALLERSGLSLVAPRPRGRRLVQRPLQVPRRPANGSETPAMTNSSIDFEGLDDDPDEQRVLSAVCGGAEHADALCARLGLPAARVQSLLLTLRLRGVLASGPSGRLVILNSAE